MNDMQISELRRFLENSNLNQQNGTQNDFRSIEIAEIAEKALNCYFEDKCSLELTDVFLVADKPISPKEAAEKYKGPLKERILELQGHYSILKIEGDGHCLFRSIAVHMARACDLSSPVKDLVMKRLYELKDKFPIFNYEIGNIEDCISMECLRDENFSNEIVLVFREIACENNKGKDLRSFLTENPEDYFSNMSTMKYKAWGGEMELQSLAEVFQVKINVKDVTGVSSVGDYNRSFSPELSSNPILEIDLLMTPSHYDCLIKEDYRALDNSESKSVREVYVEDRKKHISTRYH